MTLTSSQESVMFSELAQNAFKVGLNIPFFQVNNCSQNFSLKIFSVQTARELSRSEVAMATTIKRSS
jgi:hypothetical protein